MHPSFLDRWQPQLLSVLRIVAGLLFLEHGAVKWFGFPVAMQIPGGGIGDLLLVAGTIELIGGALVTVGVFTRWAAFIMSGEMAVAYFLGHVVRGGFWPVVNQGESAILFCFVFCFVFLYLAAAGPGPWAFDKNN